MLHSLLCVAAVAAIPSQQHTSPPPATAADQEREPVITVDGQPFYSWEEHAQSNLFREKGLRCGTPPRDPDFPETDAPGDCAYTRTIPQTEYDPTFIIDIPVVVHVITRTSGHGHISEAMVQSQIDILNEDFRAMAGSLGEDGNDAMITFHLATEDPSGAPTNGITYSANNNWFNDDGSYWDALAWDTNRYLNIYTNSASGALGYVPDLPQGGIVGQNRDRVVVLWSTFGRGGPYGPPYDKGRTTTHELGHYFGLWHTFSGGCAGI